jgi:NHLM bacteriocin system ABC transporter peptidase/ATP-binding protein
MNVVATARPRRRGRVKSPTVLQLEATECGAAALAMVLAHHKRIVPLDELRVECGISRDGSKASNIVRAARKYGLDAKGVKTEPGALRGLPVPAILHWNFNHFVVLDGFRGDRIHLNDPGSGPRVVSCTELDQSFTGVALTFAPSETFVRGGRPPSLLLSLRHRLAGTWTGLVFLFLAGTALVVPGLVAAVFEKIFLDQILVQGLRHWAQPLMLAMFATGVLSFGLTIVERRHLLLLENRLSLQGASQFFMHVLRLPVQFFTQRFAGDIANRVAINDRVAQLLGGDLARTAINLVLIVFYGTLLLHYELHLALLGAATAALNLVALRIVSRRRTFLSQRFAADHGKWMGSTMGALQSLETVKASGAEDDYFARWAGHQAKVTAVAQRLAVSSLVLSAVPGVLGAFNVAAILGLGGARVMDGQMTVGMLLAFQGLLGGFLGPVTQTVGLGGAVQELKGDLVRLDDVLGARHDPAFPPDAHTVPTDFPSRLSGAVELRKVTFGYSPLEPPLLRDFDLTLFPGSRVALVGASGSGKSTVARLLAGLYQPWSGEVLLDGTPRSQVPRPTLVRSLATVDQDIALFEGTIRSNLSLWDESLPTADLLTAVEDACLADVVAGRGGGLEASVAEGGRNFSGGQRQRLEIARALALNPSILILDEATSALDPATEKRLADNVVRRGCTCLIVAHRLSTIRDCDEILVFDRGLVVQRGTHDELIALPGPYRTLIAAEEA